MPWAASIRPTSVHASLVARTERGQKGDDDGVIRETLLCMFNASIFCPNRSVVTIVLHPYRERQGTMATTIVKQSTDGRETERNEKKEPKNIYLKSRGKGKESYYMLG